MVIDIDPDFGAANEFRRCPETILRSRVERNGHVEILRFAQWRLEEFAARQETVFLEQAVFVSDHHRFAEFGEGKGKSELTAERVAVGPHVTEHGETLVRPQNIANLRRWRYSCLCSRFAVRSVGRKRRRYPRRPQGGGYRNLAKLHHLVSAGGISICCKISKTRAPRSMESSR